jgi:hypothetical protein
VRTIGAVPSRSEVMLCASRTAIPSAGAPWPSARGQGRTSPPVSSVCVRSEQFPISTG